MAKHRFEKGNKYSVGSTSSQHKTTLTIKEMIQGALDDAGGKDYLVGIAQSHPASFLTLVGKCMPAPQPEIHNNLQLSGSWNVEVVEPAQLIAQEAIAQGNTGTTIKDELQPDEGRQMIVDQANDEELPASYSANHGLPVPDIPDYD